MKNTALQPFRLLVSLVAGVLCLAAATVYQFQTPQFNSPLARLALTAFGLAWSAQAYVIRNQIRQVRK